MGLDEELQRRGARAGLTVSRRADHVGDRLARCQRLRQGLVVQRARLRRQRAVRLDTAVVVDGRRVERRQHRPDVGHGHLCRIADEERRTEAVVAVEANGVGARVGDVDVERPVRDDQIGRVDRRLIVAICLSLLSSTCPESCAGPVVSRLFLSAIEIGRRILPGTNVLLGYRWAMVKLVPLDESSPHAASASSAPAPPRRWRREIDIVASVGVATSTEESRHTMPT